MKSMFWICAAALVVGIMIGNAHTAATKIVGNAKQVIAREESSAAYRTRQSQRQIDEAMTDLRIAVGRR